MLCHAVCRRALGVVLVAGTLVGCSPVCADASPYDKAIARALRLLPRQPEKIVLVERADGPNLRKDKPKVEAFVYRGGDKVVYLIRQGPTLQAALKRAEIFDYALAAIIWHEMAHIDGADEPAAQRAEEQLWKQFLLTHRVDSGRGLRYLVLLSDRR
jgi:hypothetical protein